MSSAREQKFFERTYRRLDERIEAGLYRRGYRHPDVRRLAANQLYILGLTLVACVPALIALAVGSQAACQVTGQISWWTLSFGAGVVIVSLNFLSLARFGQDLVHVRSGAVLAQLARFYGRLILTGIGLYVLIAWADASVAALLAGLSTVIVNALLWGTRHYLGQHTKEAK